MRILLADNQAKVVYALRVLLLQQPGLEIVGTAANAAELLSMTRALRPDMVLLHWNLQGMPAVDLLRALQGICPGSYVIALSAQLEARRASLAAGADVFVCKMDPPERLLAAIQSAREMEEAEPTRKGLAQPLGLADGGRTQPVPGV
jgi:DNA-binding NarL/FixJ family response regulator